MDECNVLTASEARVLKFFVRIAFHLVFILSQDKDINSKLNDKIILL